MVIFGASPNEDYFLHGRETISKHDMVEDGENRHGAHRTATASRTYGRTRRQGWHISVVRWVAG